MQLIWEVTDTRSYMSALVSVNLLNELRKSDKMRGKKFHILSLFHNKII